MPTIKLAKSSDISAKGKNSFGINPQQIAPWWSYRFINIMKHAGLWSDYSVVDANGYPAKTGTFTCAIHSWPGSSAVMADHSGKYIVTWDGTGTLTLTGSPISGVTPVSVPAWSSGSNAKSFLLDGTVNLDAQVSITNTDAGDCIRNIEIVRTAGTSSDPGGEHDGYEAEYAAGEILIPAVKADFAGYECLRPYWWTCETYGDHSDFDTALPDNHYSYLTVGSYFATPLKHGVPYSVVVNLANDLRFNPWFNMPTRADDTYFTKLATFVRDNLDPGLVPIFEYSNEVWNPGFGAPYNRATAQLQGWYPVQSDTAYLTDFSGSDLTGVSVSSGNVLTEDTSTGEHYLEEAVTFTTLQSGEQDRSLIVKIDPASTAPGVRLVLNDGVSTAEMTVDLSGPTIVSHSGTIARRCTTDLDGNIHLEMTLDEAVNGTGYLRIAATDGSFASSYTGSSKTVVIHSAFVCYYYNSTYSAWYGKRSVQMRDIVASVFGSRPFRTVLAWQASNIATLEGPIVAEEWETETAAGRDQDPYTYVRPGSVHDFLSPAIYFGNYNLVGSGGAVLSATHATEMWNAFDAAGGAAAAPASWDAIKDLIVHNDGADNLTGYLRDQVNALKGYISQYASRAETEGMKVVAYEGWNHCVFGSNTTDLHSGGYLKAGVLDALNYSMWHADVGLLGQEVLDHWKAEGCQTMCMLTDYMKAHATYGWFGIRQHPGDDNDAALAVDAWRAANPRYWVL